MIAQVEIGDVFDVARGGSPRPINDFITDDPEGINWIMIGDASESTKFITKTKKRILKSGVKKSRMVYPDDFLLTNSMSFGRPYILKTTGCIHDGWLVLSRKNNDVDHDYFYYLLSSGAIYSEFKRRAAGAVVKNLNIDLVKKVKIPFPPLPVQQKIAAILDAADALKQKDQALIAKYDELTQSLFLDMFGDPVTNPKGWDMKTVEEVLQRKTQNGLYLPKDKYKADGIEMIHMSDAFYGIANVGDLKKVVLTDKELEKYQLFTDDLLLARRSLTYEGAAKPCRIPIYDKPLVYESSLIRITPKKSIITPLYLYFFFSNEQAKSKYINKYISCSTISGINNKGLNSIKILLPPIDLQNQFEERVKAIESQKQQAQATLQKSEYLFNCLMQKAFKGELVS